VYFVPTFIVTLFETGKENDNSGTVVVVVVVVVVVGGVFPA